MKTTVYIATSLDGYIARADGAIDWMGEPPEEGGEDYGYENFMATVDCLVMGRNTYELVRTLGDWPYGNTSVVVLTNRSLMIPDEIAKTVESMSGTPAELIDRLSRRGMKHLYIDGGMTIQSFLNERLIQRLIITRIPVLIGTGIPLFGALHKDIKLRHIHTRSYSDGLAQSEYEVIF